MINIQPLFILQNIILPIVIAYGVLIIDQKWHAKQEYQRAFSRALSLGVDSKRHPEKVTLEALFMAAEAELEYAAEQLGKDYKKVVEPDLEHQINWWLFNDEMNEIDLGDGDIRALV